MRSKDDDWRLFSFPIFSMWGRQSTRAGVIQNTHCNENSIWVFPEKKLRDLSPNFLIYVSVSDIPRIGPHIFLQQTGRQIVGICKSLTDTWMWKLKLMPSNPFFWENLFRIFGIVSLQCRWIKARTMISISPWLAVGYGRGSMVFTVMEA